MLSVDGEKSYNRCLGGCCPFSSKNTINVCIIPVTNELLEKSAFRMKTVTVPLLLHLFPPLFIFRLENERQMQTIDYIGNEYKIESGREKKMENPTAKTKLYPLPNHLPKFLAKRKMGDPSRWQPITKK